jgi:hypothetical protein
MRRKDWVARLEKETGGSPFISKKKLLFLGYGYRRIDDLVAGLDQYPGGKGKGNLYAIEDVAERIMTARC